MTEAHLIHAILQAWGAHSRVRLARINTGKAYPPGSDRLVTFGVPGTADICGIVAPTGRFVAIECKTGTGRQSEDQRRFQRVVEQFGGIYILVRSLEDVDRFMLTLGFSRKVL